MTLELYTAQLSAYRGADALNITRGAGGVSAFAPSWTILRPAIDARRAAWVLADAGDIDGAERLEEQSWATYTPAFVSEMRASYRRERAVWEELLGRAEATICCTCDCSGDDHCHRFLLAEILVKLGARYLGERPVPEVKQQKLF